MVSDENQTDGKPMSHHDGFLRRGGLWVVTQFVLMGAILALGPWFGGEVRSPATLVGAILLWGIAAICGVAGTVALGKNLTPFPKPGASGGLVQTGIYGWMRHPLYVAVACAAAGWACFSRSWPALAVTLVLALFFDAKARREEHWLRERFAEYAAYQRKVRRFIPGIY